MTMLIKLSLQTWSVANGDFTVTILDATNGSFEINFTQTGAPMNLSQTGVFDQMNSVSTLKQKTITYS